MNKILLLLTLLLAPIASLPQARLVINGTTSVVIVENGGSSGTRIYIEIANPAANAISTLGKNGWIQSESEFNMVKWDIGSTAGTDSVPFGYGTSYSLPVVLNQSGGSAGGSILFSTFHTPADVGAGPYPNANTPSDVTSMHSFNPTGLPSATDNSYNVVDRFWIIDTYSVPAYKYGTNPTLTSITFNYAHTGAIAEFAGLNNSGFEGSLIAQRFNTTAATKTWGDWLGSGTPIYTGNRGTVVNTNAVTPGNVFRSWTLSNSNDPLPIQLSSFTAQCDNDAALIQWTSQTELDNDYYTVEKTTDGVHFETVATVPGSGTSSLPVNYSITDKSPFAGQGYYVLFQTNFDGTKNQVGNPVEFNGCGANNITTINAYNTSGYIEVQINSTDATNFNISLINILGQTMYSANHAVALGNNEIRLPNSISTGIYILNVRNDQMNYTKKMVIGVK